MTLDRLLVVDDLPDNIALIEAMLLAQGYEVDTATSGLEALAKVAAQPPSMVLLDVMMPGLSGIETTRRLKAQPNLGFIPILLITASDQASLQEGLDAGADEFLRKPLDQSELLARVRSLLRLKHSLDERDLIARQREDFVSRLTHDLRTPLVAADRMFHLILIGALGPTAPDITQALQTLRQSNHQLLTLANSLLEVYRYDAGCKTLHLTEFEALPLFQEVCNQFSALVQEKDQTLTLTVSPKVTDMVADRIEIRRVLENLLGNAIKFTEPGGQITLEVYPYGNGVEFTLKDTGPGIPLADQPYVFQRFRQGSHFKGGSGLGLYHSRMIVEAHGGRISVESLPGVGSSFRVYLR